MKKEYLECAKVVGAHGVKGALKLEVWCDSVKVLTSQKRIFELVGESYIERRVISATPMGEHAILLIEGIEGREAAQGARGKVFYLHRSDIPVRRGEILLADMIGLDVFDVDTGVRYGEIVDVSDAVRGKLYTVRCDDGREVLFPSNREFVKEIDAERGVFIRPISGFFD